MNPRLFFAFAVFFAFLLPLRAAPENRVVETHLPNGLTILTKEVHAAPVVEVMVFYKVGARNETVGETGMSHLLEHMMFKGTDRYGALPEPVGGRAQQRTEARGAEPDGGGGEPAERQGLPRGDDDGQNADHHHGERETRDERDDEVRKTGDAEQARLRRIVHGGWLSRAEPARVRVPPLSIGKPMSGRCTTCGRGAPRPIRPGRRAA